MAIARILLPIPSPTQVSRNQGIQVPPVEIADAIPERGEMGSKMFLLISGIVVIFAGGALSLFFRVRMARLGHKSAILEGGAFDFSEYHKVRLENGWAAWPVYLMWALTICGIALMVVGFFLHFGTQPKIRT
jgi:hypothetical protein